uniref:DNA-directed RNA polymerase n=1 Tax=Dracunculus medinensis TaxID=318479 RepID=A0A0N4ULQ0_DRAME
LSLNISEFLFISIFYSLKGEIKAKFLEQLSIESHHYLRVKNSVRRSKKISAEKLVKHWNWHQAIFDTLEKNIANLKTISPNEIAELMLNSILSMCGQGQDLVPYYSFELEISDPIFETIHKKFVNKFVDNIDQELFDEYIRYFFEADISRCFTLREWWLRCSSVARVNPEFRIPFTDFSVESRRELGSFLISVMLEACKFPWPNSGLFSCGKMLFAFKLRNVAVEEESLVFDNDRITLTKMIKIEPRLMDIFAEHEFEWLLFPNNLIPMKVPPRPWIEHGYGGPSYTKSTDIIRDMPEYSKVMLNNEMKTRLSSKGQARPVFDALNNLGSTPWKINCRILDVLHKVFDLTFDAKNEGLLRKLSIPLKASAIEVPDYRKIFGLVKVDEIPREEWRKFFGNRCELLKKKNETNSLWFWLKYRLIMAEHYRNEFIFFPHNMDFRGRVYPISPYLSHMGDDLNRSLLLFAEGRALGSRGLSWLKVHCINLCGQKKRSSIEERMDFAEKMLPNMLDSANKPMNGSGWWMESDEPWQTLATCMEIQEAINYHPELYISHLPVHQDGSCNGLQHYAALGRDKQGGSEVNLVPNNVPSDVYTSVAQRIEQKRIEDENSNDTEVKELALALRRALPGPLHRKVIKQTVMTTVYGVTVYGAQVQIKRQLKLFDIPLADVCLFIVFVFCHRFAKYLAQKTFKSLHDAFISSMKLKDWFRQCASEISKLMQPVEWITPLGLPVVQPYLEIGNKNGKLCLLPIKHKQVNAFPPNFIHSLDSTHMMLTSLHCHKLGVTFTAVHDCYWTHAASVELMNSICREQFILLHKQALVTQCAEFFRKKYISQRLRDIMDETDVNYLEEVFTPNIVTGDLDIETIRDSIYFFS